MSAITYLLTSLLMELSRSLRPAHSAATQEFPSILWNPKVHYRVHVFQTGSGVHPTSYQIGTGGSFPEGKAAGT
jgi:hypothetical protein